MLQRCTRCDAPISVIRGESLLCTPCSFALSEAERDAAPRARDEVTAGAPREAKIAIVAPIVAVGITLLVAGNTDAFALIVVIEVIAFASGAIAIREGNGGQFAAGCVGIVLALLSSFLAFGIMVASHNTAGR